jgi:hypothetical protein
MAEPALPQSSSHVEIVLDTYAVTTSDQVLCTTLTGSLVVCLYDAVEEAGALLHLRVVPPNLETAVAELTDELLASDLLLLERCCAALRAACPAARHWQARLVVHTGTDRQLVGSAELLLGFVRAHAAESGIEIVQTLEEAGTPLRLHFRPAMGWVRTGR